jgi:hypothetical protein
MRSPSELNVNSSSGGASIKERVAILKRFRELLIEQRERFKAYLDVLGKQKTVIESGDAENLVVHIEIEEKILNDIHSVQKSIEPMKVLLGVNSDSDIKELNSSLESLSLQAVKRIDENKKLLQSRMNVLRNEIAVARSNPFKKRRSVFSDSAQPSLVDIKG